MSVLSVSARSCLLLLLLLLRVRARTCVLQRSLGAFAAAVKNAAAAPLTLERGGERIEICDVLSRQKNLSSASK